MGTDNDVGQPAFRSDGWYAAREAEQMANLTGDRRARYDQLVDAVGVDVATLSPRARMSLVWLAGWEQPTIEGIIEVLDATSGTAPTGTLADVARLVDAIETDDDPTGWAPESGAA